MIDPISQYKSHRPGAIEGDALEKIVGAIEKGTKGKLCKTFSYALGFMVFIMGVVALIAYMKGVPVFEKLWSVLTNPAFILPNLYWIVMIPRSWVTRKRTRRKKTYAQLLKHRRCPHCGFDIRGLGVDPMDGATICPECTAAWKLDDPAIEAMCRDSCGSYCTGRFGRGRVIGAILLAALVAAGVVLWFR
ncbi:MAG: hypothetical protein O7G85_06480 [Planctomycetota bacterium]|nr:hypothetical protein [Planctomycetota bacterium]